ncbi:MAG: hypothetical protein AAGD01_16750 [Acidobacteriota bacterium]
MSILDQALSYIHPALVGLVCLVVVFVVLLERLVKAWQALQEGLLAKNQRQESNSIIDDLVRRIAELERKGLLASRRHQASNAAMEDLIRRIEELNSEFRSRFKPVQSDSKVVDFAASEKGAQLPITLGLKTKSQLAEAGATRPNRRARSERSNPGTSSSGGEPSTPTSPLKIYLGADPGWDYATSASVERQAKPWLGEPEGERYFQTLAAA